MEKQYKVTEEIAELFLEGNAAEDCRDAAVESLFFSKRAIEYGKTARRAFEKAWNLIYDLYPELRGKGLTFRRKEMDVVINEK